MFEIYKRTRNYSKGKNGIEGILEIVKKEYNALPDHKKRLWEKEYCELVMEMTQFISNNIVRVY